MGEIDAAVDFEFLIIANFEKEDNPYQRLDKSFITRTLDGRKLVRPYLSTIKR